MTVGRHAQLFVLPAVGGRLAECRLLPLEHFHGSWLAMVYFAGVARGDLVRAVWALNDHRSEFVDRGCDLLPVCREAITEMEELSHQPRAAGGLEGLQLLLACDSDGTVAQLYGVAAPDCCGVFVVAPSGALDLHLGCRRPTSWKPDEILRFVAAAQGLIPSDDAQPDLPRRLSEVFAPGNVVENYLIDGHIADGSFAKVFRAIDVQLQRPAALKVVKPSSGFPPAALLNEARAIAALCHPNICTVFGAFEVEGNPVIAMEFLEGKPLAHLLSNGLPLPQLQAADIGRQIAAGMAAAHAQGIFHSDLKPANVLVSADGNVKVVDFGLARRDKRSVDPDGTVIVPVLPPDAIIGTPSYMSPEQSFGKPALAASDVFSLGVILYEMVGGARPFPGRDMAEVVVRVRNVDAAVLAGDLPEPFASIVLRALARDPATRQISMADIESRLDAFCRSVPGDRAPLA